MYAFEYIFAVNKYDSGIECYNFEHKLLGLLP